jgi:hypothetical protein
MTLMATDTIYYTDGHAVVVTDKSFKVNRREFKLPGITRHSLTQIKPYRAPGVLTLIVGISMFLIGLLEFEFLPSVSAIKVQVIDVLIGIDIISMAAGVLVVFVGFLLIIAAKPKFAVRISTAEGDLNAVVSRRSEYIHQIIDGLNRAFMSRGQKA